MASLNALRSSFYLLSTHSLYGHDFYWSRGASHKYITIKGIPGPLGERPVLDGHHAVMPSNTGGNQYTESGGMVIIAKPSISGRSILLNLVICTLQV